jgi:hypothetical protein
MTGPAVGKLKLEAEVFLEPGHFKLDGASVFIHLKGYSLARVTHLDIEHEALDNLIPPKRGGLHRIEGVRGGISIKLKNPKETSRGIIKSVRVKCSHLNSILKPGEITITWVGGKAGGIYIGFRKPQIALMERLAREKLGWTGSL